MLPDVVCRLGLEILVASSDHDSATLGWGHRLLISSKSAPLLLKKALSRRGMHPVSELEPRGGKKETREEKGLDQEYIPCSRTYH